MSTVAEKVVSALPNHKLPQRPRLTGLCLAASDALAMSFAIAAGFVILLGFHEPIRLTDGLVAVGSALLLFAAFGLYTIVGLSPVQEFQRVLLGSTIGYGMAAMIFF